MSNERDELARVIAGTRFKAGTRRPQSSLEQADSILAAGYRKPRTITTPEELDELTAGSVIRDSQGGLWEFRRKVSNKPAWWSAHLAGFWFSSNISDSGLLPATALHEGPAS